MGLYIKKSFLKRFAVTFYMGIENVFSHKKSVLYTLL